MKKHILILALLHSTIPELFAQSRDTTYLINEYFRKSETQKKTGLIMLGAGLGAAALGVQVFAEAFSGGSEGAGTAGQVLFFAGAISTLASIPVLISSGSNSRKAANLTIQTQSLPGIRPKGISGMYPALNLSIPIN